MNHRLINLLFSIIAFAAYSFAHADEKIGTFSVEELRLRPTYMSTEGQGGVFSLDDSAFGVGWRKDKLLSAYFEVGPLASRMLTGYWNLDPEDGYGFTKAYAQYDGIYGRVRFGLIPIGFGYEGSVNPQDRYFQWSQLMTSKLIGYDDIGLSFFTQYNGFFTEFIIHNGEIETSGDGRLWATAHFGWTNNLDWRVQLSLQTGFVNGDQSSPTFNVGNVTPGETAKWRNGALFVNWKPRDWNVVFQAAGGQVAQDSTTGNYSADLAEATHFFTKNFGLGLRYDYFNPYTATGANETTAGSLLIALKSDDSTSTVLIAGTKNIHDSSQVHDDELMLTWLLTPYTH
jgi:hypothetical protein